MASVPSSGSLVGPPELSRTRHTPTGNPFVDAMVSSFNTAVTVSNPTKGRTENGSATFLSSGNPCLDFFFHVVPDSPPESVTSLLSLAWAHDPLTSLKLVLNLRGVRGSGKSDKEGFYASALWLHGLHPKTLACNVGTLAEAGYLKDLPEILFRLLHGPAVRLKLKNDRNKRNKSPYSRYGRVVKVGRNTVMTRHAGVEKMKASETREERKFSAAKKALKRYTTDPDYRYLFDRVSDYFAQRLRADLESFRSNDLRTIGLAAKWCPSLDSSFDRATLLCESIARKVFPKEDYPEYRGVEDSHYAYRVRDRLRKDVLVPLRKALELPEVYIGANRWGDLPYDRVASVAMRFYKEKFLKHDKERFEEYLAKVRDGKATVAAGALLPHEIVGSLKDGDGGEVAELQWRRMVDDVAKKGRLKDCMAVCDVSGSMDGVPMEVSVAMGVLVSELSEDPWKGKLVTFSSNPTLQMVLGEGLREKTEFVRGMDWGTNTDFQKVFDLLLEVAVNNRLAPDQMIKRVFVFSDMEFDQASGRSRVYYGRNASSWETDYEVIERKFREKGYAVPEIVFWNLRNSRATPVPGNQKGVALVSGYSKNLMTLFLDEGKELDPESVMKAAISGPEYDRLVVVD